MKAKYAFFYRHGPGGPVGHYISQDINGKFERCAPEMERFIPQSAYEAYQKETGMLNPFQPIPDIEWMKSL